MSREDLDCQREVTPADGQPGSWPKSRPATARPPARRPPGDRRGGQRNSAKPRRTAGPFGRRHVEQVVRHAGQRMPENQDSQRQPADHLRHPGGRDRVVIKRIENRRIALVEELDHKQPNGRTGNCQANSRNNASRGRPALAASAQANGKRGR